MGANRAALAVCVVLVLSLAGCGPMDGPKTLSAGDDDYVESSSGSSGGYEGGGRNKTKSYDSSSRNQVKSYRPKKQSRQVTTSNSAGPEKHGGFGGMVGDTYDTSKSVCEVFGVAKVAKDLHMSSAEPVNVAQKFSDGYWGRHTQAAFEGCLAGFGY